MMSTPEDSREWKGIIDAHVHAYAEELWAQPGDWARQRREEHWAWLASSPLQGWADGPRLVADMDRDGLERSLLLGWYWQRSETCEEQNRWYAQWIKEYPDRLLAFCAFCPAGEAEKDLDTLERAREQGFRGVGELLPTVQGYSVRDSKLRPVWEWLVGAKWPVNFHATEAAGHEYAGRVDTVLNDYVWLAREYPELRIILAHWGGGLPFFELNPRVRGVLGNVWYDTAASPLLYDPDVWRRVLDLVGPERILFGSDYPLRLHPGSGDGPGWNRLLSEARAALTEAEQSAVMGGNLLRILE